MSAFMPDYDVVTVSATSGNVSNVAVQTSGPGTFYVTNAGTVPVQVGLTQSGAPTGNVVIPGGWPQMLQSQNPERTPGTIYVWVKPIGGDANVYISSGFET